MLSEFGTDGAEYIRMPRTTDERLAPAWPRSGYHATLPRRCGHAAHCGIVVHPSSAYLLLVGIPECITANLG